MGHLFTEVLVKPIFNLLVVFYGWFGNDLGVAIIMITVLLKIILYPLQASSLKSQKKLQELQPKIDEIRKKHADQKDQQAQELMRLYKEQKINPFSSCLPLLIQLPILLAVYRVFTIGINSDFGTLLYSFIGNPGHINTLSLGLLDLANKNIPLAALAALAQYWQSKMMLARTPQVSPGSNNPMANMNKQMLYFLPILTLVFGFQFPSGLILYWLVTTLLMVVQQYWFLRKKKGAVGVVKG